MVVRNGTFNYSNIIEKVSYHLLLHLVVVFKSEMLNLNLNIDSKQKKKNKLSTVFTRNLDESTMHSLL